MKLVVWSNQLPWMSVGPSSSCPFDGSGRQQLCWAVVEEPHPAQPELSPMHALEPRPLVRLYEHDGGHLRHLNIKKLGRIVRPSHRATGNRPDWVEVSKLSRCHKHPKLRGGEIFGGRNQLYGGNDATHGQGRRQASRPP